MVVVDVQGYTPIGWVLTPFAPAPSAVLAGSRFHKPLARCCATSANTTARNNDFSHLPTETNETLFHVNDVNKTLPLMGDARRHGRRAFKAIMRSYTFNIPKYDLPLRIRPVSLTSLLCVHPTNKCLLLPLTSGLSDLLSSSCSRLRYWALRTSPTHFH